MAKINYTLFRGIRPLLASHLIGENQAITAENSKIESGELRPWYNEQYTDHLTIRESVLTLYRYISDSYWFEWSADVDIVESAISGDTADKRYYTGDGIPKKTNRTEALTGSGAYPINFYPMGAPVPVHAPIAGAPGAGGTGEARDVAYVWTVVTSWGEEGPPSEPSNVVSPTQGQAVALSNMTLVWQAAQAYTTGSWIIPSVLGDYVYKCVSAGTSGGAEPEWGQTVDGDTTDGTVTWRCYKKGILYDSGGVKNIYRTNTGDITSDWQLLTSISMASTTHNDTSTDDDLEATILPSSDWDPPPDGLTGLVAVSGGFNAGFVGKDLYLSEPYYPHAWPYRYALESTIIGLGTIGNAVVVITEREPVIFNGSHPDSMTPKKLPDPRSCVSKRGILSFKGGVVYPSRNGLEWIDGTSRRTLTQDHYSKDEWANVYPTTFNAAYHNDCYFGFFSSGGNEGCVVINLITGEITTLDFYTAAVYVEPTTDKMYYIKTYDEVRLLENGTTYPSRTNARLTEAGDYRLLEE